LYNFLLKNSFESKLEIIPQGSLGAALAIIVGKPLGRRIFNEGVLEKIN
jgi:hypothetical protein